MKWKHVYLEFFVVLVLWVLLAAVYLSLGFDKRPIDRIFFETLYNSAHEKAFYGVCLLNQSSILNV